MENHILAVQEDHAPELYDQNGMNRIPYIAVVAAATLILNSLQVYVFAKMKKRTFSNVLFLFIAISDAMFGAVSVPIFTVNQVFMVWPLGRFMCYVNIVLIGLNFSCSTYWILMLSFNRLLQITRPYTNHERTTKRKILIILLPLLAVTSYSLLNLIGHIWTRKFNHSHCSLEINKFQLLFQSVIMSSGPAACCVLVNVVNIILLYRKRKSFITKKSSKDRYSKNAEQSKGSSSVVSVEIVQLKAKKVSSIKCKSTKASTCTVKSSDRVVYRRSKSSRLNRDKKAVLCIIMLVLNAILTQSLAAVFYPLMFFCHWAQEMFNIGLNFAYAFPLVNPLLVFIFHDSFRNDLKRKVATLFCKTKT